jgi:hypothetical protein
MDIDVRDEVPMMFIKAVDDRNVEEISFWFEKLREYVKANEKDKKNLYFDRMRIYINQEFGTTFNYAKL